MHRSHRTRHASAVPGWGPAAEWDQPLPGWNPLLNHGPLPLRAAGSVARWWWPTLAVASFLAVAVYVTGHDPGLSQRGLLTIALAALLTLTAAGNQQPVTPAAKGEAKHPATARAEASQDRPRVLRVVAGAIRAVTKAVRAVIGAVGWLVDLWRQADAKTDHPNRSTATTRPKAEAISPSPTHASTSIRRST